MRFNFFIKAIPLFSTIFLILFLGFSNRSENTKLRILIWNTPSLTLGSYLGISSATGFILAYCINNSLSRLNKFNPKQQLKANDLNQSLEFDDRINDEINPMYDNILIERDIKDPSPTITANFRIISKNETSYNGIQTSHIHDNNTSIPYESNVELSDEKESMNELNLNSKDWSDQSFSDW